MDLCCFCLFACVSSYTNGVSSVRLVFPVSGTCLFLLRMRLVFVFGVALRVIRSGSSPWVLSFHHVHHGLVLLRFLRIYLLTSAWSLSICSSSADTTFDSLSATAIAPSTDETQVERDREGLREVERGREVGRERGGEGQVEREREREGERRTGKGVESPSTPMHPTGHPPQQSGDAMGSGMGMGTLDVRSPLLPNQKVGRDPMHSTRVNPERERESGSTHVANTRSNAIATVVGSHEPTTNEEGTETFAEQGGREKRAYEGSAWHKHKEKWKGWKCWP
eukprot:scaffold616_cov306-Pavlova_lutheri.AAC.40